MPANRISKRLFKNWRLIGQMAYKEISDHYAGSVFGVFWTVLKPLSLIALYAVIFTFVFKVPVGGNNAPINYALFALAGLIPWISMSEALVKSIAAVSSKSALVKQAIFPIEVLPVSSVLASILPMIIGFIIFLLIVIVSVPSKLTPLMLLLPLIIFLQFLFTVGTSYFLASAGVYLKDLSELVALLLTVGMFITPILYIENMIPTAFAWSINFNLFAHLIYMYKDVLFYGAIIHPWSFWIFGAAAVIIFISGHYFFKKVKHYFANIL